MNFIEMNQIEDNLEAINITMSKTATNKTNMDLIVV